MNTRLEESRGRFELEELSAIVGDTAYQLHKEAGPGLLETVYEVVLARALEARGLEVKRQTPVPIEFMGMNFDEGFRADLIVEDALFWNLSLSNVFRRSTRSTSCLTCVC